MNSFKKQSGVAAIELTVLAAVVIFAALAIPAQAQTETLLYQFAGNPDGFWPTAGPLLKGTTLYGTTEEGGLANGYAYGTVYAISTTTGKETILHTFAYAPDQNGDGSKPLGGLASDAQGNLYGTTANGGASCNCGTVYKLTKSKNSYVETVLYSFSMGEDGGYPYYVTPVLDKQGNLYGTTWGGGHYSNGTVFKLTPGGTLTTLHSFDYYTGDGYNPDSGVALDTKGNIYGTTSIGGAYGNGVLYEITAAGAYSILYNFTGGADGWAPQAPPVYKGGSLYGTTQAGGAGCTWGCGVIFKYTLAKGKKPGKETVLYTFSGVPDGQSPLYGALVFDKSGNLYGTTQNGGDNHGATNVGTVYKLAPNGTMTILYSFDDVPDGSAPQGNVALDTKGNVYTTAAYGGNNGGEYGGGTVVKITP